METVISRCPPINTARLQPIRQRINRHVVTITEYGHVSMEFKCHVTSKSDRQVEVTKELFRIFPDGRQIEVYHNTEGVPSVGGDPVSCQPDQMFTYPSMPDKIWKKYCHAHKFVEVVKSRTSKVILITDRAQCKLMENSPNADFQVCFSNGVILVLSKLKVTLTDQDGSILTFTQDVPSSHVSPNTLHLLEYSQQCQDQCLKIEKSVSDLHPGGQGPGFFPITVGINNQPFLLPSQPMFSPPRRNQANSEVAHYSSDTWITTSNQGNSLLSQDNNETEARAYRQQEYSADLCDCRQSTNVIQCNSNECHSQHECSYVHKNESSAEKICYTSSASPGYINSPQVPRLHTTLHTQAECQDLVSGHFTQCEDLSSNSRQQSHLTLATPQKTNNRANCSLQFNCSSCKHHLLPQSTDIVEQNLPKKIANCDIADRLLDQHDMSGQILGADLVNKFESESSIPQHLNSIGSSSSSACLCNQCTNVENTESERPALCTMCQTNAPDNIYFQQPHEIYDTNVTDSAASQFLNNFITPQKSSIPFDSYHHFCNSNLLKHQHHKQSAGYNLAHDVYEKGLQNVRRNLFSDQTSKELISSPLPTFQANISRQDFLELSDYNSSEDSSSLNIGLPQAGLTQDSHKITSEPQVWSSHVDSSSCQSVGDTAVTVATLSSPVRVPNINKSVVRYSECDSTPIKAQSGTLAFPCQMYVSVIHKNTQIDKPSKSQSAKDSYDSFEISKAVCKSNFSDISFTPQIPPESVPQITTSPRKSAPVRKIAILSPLKMSSKMLGEGSSHNNPAAKPTEMMPCDFFPCGHQTNSNQQSRSNSSRNAGLSNNTQSRENPVHSCDPGRLKEFPAISREAGEWSGLDLPLSHHVRNSLDISSDGHSSPPSSVSDVICQMFVPDTGWASFYSTGTVWILYNDGSQIGVTSTEASVIYIDQDGSRKRYTNSDMVPAIVQLKLEKLPKIIDLLMKSRTASDIGTLLQ